MTWKEEATRGCAGTDGVGEAFELHSFALNFAKEIDKMCHLTANLLRHSVVTTRKQR